MAREDRRHVGRHRTVQIGRQVGNLARRLEPVQQVQQRLRAADGEGRDDHDAAARGAAPHHVGELLRRVLLPVRAVAVGGFDEHPVGARRRHRWPHHQVVAAAEVAREQHRARAAGEMRAGRAEDVAGTLQAHREAGQRLEGRVEVARLEAPQRAPRRLLGVQRQRRRVLGKAVPVRVARLFVLQVAGIGQQQPAQLDARRRGEHLAAKAELDQARNEAAVVDVRMRQQHRVDRGRRHRQRRPVAQAQLLQALEQPAIDEQAPAVVFDEVLRSRHGAGGTEELQSHQSLPGAAPAPCSSSTWRSEPPSEASASTRKPMSRASWRMASFSCSTSPTSRCVPRPRW